MLSLSDIITICKKVIKPTHNRVVNMIRFGVVTLVKNGKTREVQVETLGGEVIDNVKFLEPFGFTSKPPVGSETLIFNVNGNAANNVVLNIGNREFRFKGCATGEVAMYDQFGNIIHLKTGGNMNITAPETIDIEAKTANVTAENLNIKASLAKIEAQIATIKAEFVNLGDEGGKPFALVGSKVGVNPATGAMEVLDGATKVKGV